MVHGHVCRHGPKHLRLELSREALEKETGEEVLLVRMVDYYRVCDPVGGYVEVPCVSRNGMFAVHRFQAAVMAFAGPRCIVPLDDVVIAMRDIGRRVPRALKETSEAGLASTPYAMKFIANQP